MFLEFSGNGLDFASFGTKQALQALWGPMGSKSWTIWPGPGCFERAYKGIFGMKFGIDLVDSQNYVFFPPSNVSKHVFWNLRGVFF